MNALKTTTQTMTNIATIADTHAAANSFAEAASRKATNTNASRLDALKLFAEYLSLLGVECNAEGLATSPEHWRGITHGIVKGFVGFMIGRGYAVTTINNRLSAIKSFAKIAMNAGAIEPDTYTQISAITGYSVKEGRRLDAKRETNRVGAKKETANVLTNDQLKQLRTQPNTPQGKRDSVMIRLMADLGLRVGEVVSLTIEAVNLENFTITFYREKVAKSQTHRLTNGLLSAMRDYLRELASMGITSGTLIRASIKGGKLVERAMSRQTIEQRLKTLGAEIGIDNLGCHDLRHTWATLATQRGTPITALRDAGGWSSLAMPSRYIEASEIANVGVIGGE